jgi:hypothetical protein
VEPNSGRRIAKHASHDHAVHAPLALGEGRGDRDAGQVESYGRWRRGGSVLGPGCGIDAVEEADLVGDDAEGERVLLDIAGVVTTTVSILTHASS